MADENAEGGGDRSPRDEVLDEIPSGQACKRASRWDKSTASQQG